MSSNDQWRCKLWNTNDTYLGYLSSDRHLGYLSAVSVNTLLSSHRNLSWPFILHQWLNTTETLTNSLLNEKQVSFTCEPLFPWEAIISNLQLHWFSGPALTSMLCHGHHCILTVQAALPIHERQQMNEFRVQSSSLHHWTTTRCKSRIDWDTGSVNGLQRCAVGVDSVCCAANKRPSSHITIHLCCILGRLKQCLLFQHGTFWINEKHRRNLVLIYLCARSSDNRRDSADDLDLLKKRVFHMAQLCAGHRRSDGGHVFRKKRWSFSWKLKAHLKRDSELSF